jgi:hypothetical protein
VQHFRKRRVHIRLQIADRLRLAKKQWYFSHGILSVLSVPGFGPELNFERKVSETVIFPIDIRAFSYTLSIMQTVAKKQRRFGQRRGLVSTD